MFKRSTSCVLVVLLAAATASGQTDLSKFPLVKAVPADAFITVASRGNSERAFIDEYWSDVIKALHDSEILLDVWDLISESIPDEQLDQFEDFKDRLLEHCGKIAWDDLFAREMVYAGRFMSTEQAQNYTLIYEGMLAGRLPGDEAEKSYAGMKDVFNEIIEFVNKLSESGTLRLDETEAAGANVATLRFTNYDAFGLRVARRGDVIMFTFGGTRLMEEALELLKKGEGGLAGSERFRSAFDRLPPAEDVIVFFDSERMMGTFRAMFRNVQKQAAATQPAEVDESVEFFKLLSKGVEDLSIIDYVASSAWTENHRTFEDTYTKLREGATSSPFYKVIASGQPLDKFERFIPKEADSFKVSSGLSLSQAYDWLIGLVENNLTNGKSYIEQWNNIQATTLKLDIKKDVLALFDGFTVSVAMDNDWVFIAKVTDSEKLKGQVDRLFAFLGKQAEQFLGPNAIQLVPVQIGEYRDFQQISMPMMAMMMAAQGQSLPIIGYAKGCFFAGSSKAALRRCLNTADGEHDDITKSQRWKDEALVPKGQIVSVWFTDEMQYAEETVEAINGFTMALNMMQMAPVPLPPELLQIVGKVTPFLPKLAKIAEKLDFYRSRAGYSAKIEGGWMDRKVQNYKTPAEVKSLRAKKEAAKRSEEPADTGEPASEPNE